MTYIHVSRATEHVRILTEDLAKDFNRNIGNNLNNRISLKTLTNEVGLILKGRRPPKGSDYLRESYQLVDYLRTLDRKQRAGVMRVIRTTRRGLFKMFENPSHEQITVGLLRNFDSEALVSIYGLNKASAKFIQTAFARE